MPPAIRVLTLIDAERMAELHAQGFIRGWPQSDMAEHVQTDIVLGIGAPLEGFLIVRRSFEQAELLTIIVSAQSQNAGLGQALLSAGEAAAAQQGAEIMFLEVAEDNLSAIRLYRKAGYESLGRRPAYYKRPDGRVAALILRKKLDASRPTG